MDSTHSFEIEAYLDTEEKDQKKIQSSTLFRLFHLMIQHKRQLLMGLFMIVLGTFSALLEPRLFGYAIDDAIVPKRWNQLKMIVGVFFGITSLRVMAAIQQSYFFEVLGQKVTQDLRLMIFSHLQRMPISVLEKHPAGRLMTRVTNDVAALSEMFSSGFVSMICNGLLVMGILIGLLMLDLRLGLIATSVFPFLAAISIYFSGRLKAAYRDSRSKLSGLNSFLAENLAGIKTVHLFNRQKVHLAQFERLNQWYANAQTSSIRVFALFQPTITISSGISIALIIWFGGRETLNGNLKLGILVAYFSYILSLFQPVRELADKWNTFLSGMTSAERIFSILSWPTELDRKNVDSAAVPLAELRGHFVFENVWFAYEGEAWILKDFSWEIQAGTRLGVVGHTGAGKSTLIHLLLRFYEPQRGRILLDGKDLKTYDKRSLRTSIGIVQQEVFLFSGSLEDNITFWDNRDPHKTKNILMQMKLNHLGGTLLQEGGSNLSMGERQGIAFSRVMAADPRIWILDEATANLDSDSELLLQQALEARSKNLTSILIAHRLSTVRSADQIIVLHKGHLVESGKHEDLIQMNGLYARLYRYQKASS